MNLRKKGIIGEISLIGNEILKKLDSNNIRKERADVC
jgi:hypothetical protein